LCRRFNVPLYEIKNINDLEAIELLQALALDLLFVIGWTQILRSAALQTAKIGVIGAHASLLPHHRGRAPINWALIKGAKQTGNSLMWLAEDVDGGDLIDQRAISITAYDTCHSLYERVAASNQEMIVAALAQIKAGERPGRPQPPLRGRIRARSVG
jgi:methionyl-tRNA formyltransferase